MSMRSKVVATLTLALLALGWPGHAQADPLILCNVGGLGNTEQARDPINKFLRHLEKSVGIKANSMTGEYHTKLDACLKYVKESKPSLGVVDLATYLSQREALKLVPLAHMGGKAAKRYHVVVRKGEFKDLAALKGKRFYSSQHNARFVSQVILGAKLDLAKDTTLKTKKQIKCLKAVGRKKRDKFKGDAALVEEATFKRRKELSKLVELESIHRSDGMPGLTVVVVNGRASKDLVCKIRKALPRLCAGAGKDLCDQFQMTSFKPASAATYKPLQTAYSK